MVNRYPPKMWWLTPSLLLHHLRPSWEFLCNHAESQTNGLQPKHQLFLDYATLVYTFQSTWCKLSPSVALMKGCRDKSIALIFFTFWPHDAFRTSDMALHMWHFVEVSKPWMLSLELGVHPAPVAVIVKVVVLHLHSHESSTSCLRKLHTFFTSPYLSRSSWDRSYEDFFFFLESEKPMNKVT